MRRTTVRTRSTLKFLAVFVVIAALAIPAFADNTGTLTISGTMPLLQTISASLTGNVLDLVNGVTGMTIATVTETCNRKTGYTISVSDANSGALVKVGATESIPYTLSYNGGTYFTPGTTQAQVSTVAGKTPKGGVAVPLKITVPAPSVLFDDGTFSDLLTFTITAQ
jgi:hypothetical protein